MRRNFACCLSVLAVVMLLVSPLHVAAQDGAGDLWVPLPPAGVAVSAAEPEAAAAVTEAGGPPLPIAQFAGDDLAYLSQAGEPALPYRVYEVLLPPGTVADSLAVAIEAVRFEPVAGEWDVRPMPPATTWVDGVEIADWPADRDIVDGRDVAIYGADAPFPAAWLAAYSAGQMHQWRLAQVPVALYQYNPVTHQLFALTAATLRLTYERDLALAGALAADGLSADPDVVRTVEQAAINFDQAAPDYAPLFAPLDAPPAPGYAIITTSQVRSGSTALGRFVRSKELRGFQVYVVTEEAWGGGQGDQAAENLRAWLRANYVALGLKYVLLIGGAHPELGDVPMKLLWPLLGNPYYPTAASDYYYADLSGNWDLDGDGLYGERYEDFGPGGIDRNWEVLIGRIPFYGSLPDLDHILNKSANYENAPASAAGWRQKALLPMMRMAWNEPSYRLGEAIKDNFLAPLGWGYYRMYEQGFGLEPPPEAVCSTSPSLCADNMARVAAAWNAFQPGYVAYQTHGSVEGANYVMSYAHALTLADRQPAIVFQGSCSNAWPHSSRNLAYTLLRTAAVGVVGATEVSWYFPGEADYAGSTTISGLVYEYSRRLVQQEMPAGLALYDMKQTLANSIWANFTVFNLYGDPSIGLFTFGSDAAVPYATVSDPGDGSGQTLRWAIGALAEAGEIDFDLPPGTTIQLANGPLLITKTMSIRGPGAADLTISGGGLSRVFDVAPGVSLTLDGLTISGGLAQRASAADPLEAGGGIRNLGALGLSNCVVSGNRADQGGGLHNAGTLNVRDCVISGNVAGGAGGGLANEGTLGANTVVVSGNQAGEGGGLWNGGAGSANLYASQVTDNQADQGGGLANGGQARLVIQGSSLITGNHAAAAGGGLINHAGGWVEIHDTQISDNAAEQDGGGAYNAGGTLLISTSTLAGNQAANGGGAANGGSLTVLRTTFDGNQAGSAGSGDGGAIFNEAELQVSDSPFQQNQAYRGGALFNGGAGPALLTNSLLAGNHAALDGGAIAVSAAGQVTLRNTTLAANTAAGGGGGLAVLAGGAALVEYSTLAENAAPAAGGILNLEAGTVQLAGSLLANGASGGNCAGPVSSLGYSLADDASCAGLTQADARLMPLAPTGGPTWAYPLLRDSPALDAIPLAACAAAADQRGVARPQGGACDIGAYEALQLTVAIDVKPKTTNNLIALSNLAKVPVAVLSAPGFNAPDAILPATLAFGHSGWEPSLYRAPTSGKLVCGSADMNADGRLDLVCDFVVPLSGLRLGDIRARLSAQIPWPGYDLAYVFGSDSVVIVP